MHLQGPDILLSISDERRAAGRQPPGALLLRAARRRLPRTWWRALVQVITSSTIGHASEGGCPLPVRKGPSRMPICQLKQVRHSEPSKTETGGEERPLFRCDMFHAVRAVATVKLLASQFHSSIHRLSPLF